MTVAISCSTLRRRRSPRASAWSPSGAASRCRRDALVGPDGLLTGDPDVLYGETLPGAVPDPRKGPGALTAMGAHKGSGLALACELLAGALTGSGTCGPGERIHNGMLSIYIDPRAHG